MNVENQRNSSALRNPTDRKSVNIQRNERFRFKGPIFPSFYGGDTYQLFTKRDTWGDFQIQLVVRARLELTRFSCKPSAVTTRSQWVFRNWNYFLFISLKEPTAPNLPPLPEKVLSYLLSLCLSGFLLSEKRNAITCSYKTTKKVN